MQFPQIGKTVQVWPHPGLSVPELDHSTGRVLPPDGASVVWSRWLQKRYLDGSIHLTDPRPPIAAPAQDTASSQPVKE